MHFGLYDLDTKKKNVMVRVDFNVPVRDGMVTDDLRIRAALPTISYLLKNQAKVILISHRGRPKGRVNPSYSLEPVVTKLQTLLKNTKVHFVCDYIKESKEILDFVNFGEVVVFENLRFYSQEKENDHEFAQKLASYADVYVNDASATIHRCHASIDAITTLLPSACGLLIEKECHELSKILEPKSPFVCVIGGAKVSDKIQTIEHLAHKSNCVLVGGAIAGSFLQAKGVFVGNTRTDAVEVAKRILKAFNKKFLLPVDAVVAPSLEKDAPHRIVPIESIPKGWMMLDVGPKTCELFEKELSLAQTIFWNGPLGVFEIEQFSNGTKRVAQLISELSGVRMVGGSETAEVVHSLSLENKFTYVATGGGASLEFLSGKKLPAFIALEKNYENFKTLLQA